MLNKSNLVGLLVGGDGLGKLIIIFIECNIVVVMSDM